MSEISIIDYGLNNLKSVRKVFEEVGRDVEIVTHGSEIDDPAAIILPGIGTFGDGMAELRDRKLVEPINAHVAAGKPMLGICLGMQLLFTGSYEIEYNTGLDLLSGDVVRFAAADKIGNKRYKVPQVGWNEIRPSEESGRSWAGSLLEQIDSGADVYFVHSLYPEPENPDDILAVSEYGNQTFPAVVQQGSVVGTQFHPEKSGTVGITIINSFCEQFGL